MRKLVLILAFLIPTLALTACATTSGSKYDKEGYAAFVVEERLWVFKDPSKELDEYRATGHEPGKLATAIGAGPNGMTVKAPDNETLQGYLNAK